MTAVCVTVERIPSDARIPSVTSSSNGAVGKLLLTSRSSTSSGILGS
jgi:hypothetical protein